MGSRRGGSRRYGVPMATMMRDAALRLCTDERLLEALRSVAPDDALYAALHAERQRRVAQARKRAAVREHLALGGEER